MPSAKAGRLGRVIDPGPSLGTDRKLSQPAAGLPSASWEDSDSTVQSGAGPEPFSSNELAPASLEQEEFSLLNPKPCHDFLTCHQTMREHRQSGQKSVSVPKETTHTCTGFNFSISDLMCEW